MCTKIMYNDKLDAVSRIILPNLRLKKRENGEVTVLQRFVTEEERIEALEREFGIVLSREEKDRIKGRRLAVGILDPEAPTYGF